MEKVDFFLDGYKAFCGREQNIKLLTSANIIFTIVTVRCPTTWDGIMCWESTLPGEIAVQRCPNYIAGFDKVAS